MKFNRRYLVRSTVLLAAALVVGLLSGLSGVMAASESPEDMGGQWLETPLSLSNPCDEALRSTHRCVEWCENLQGSAIRPTGSLCCIANDDLPNRKEICPVYASH